MTTDVSGYEKSEKQLEKDLLRDICNSENELDLFEHVKNKMNMQVNVLFYSDGDIRPMNLSCIPDIWFPICSNNFRGMILLEVKKSSIRNKLLDLFQANMQLEANIQMQDRLGGNIAVQFLAGADAMVLRVAKKKMVSGRKLHIAGKTTVSIYP